MKYTRMFTVEVHVLGIFYDTGYLKPVAIVSR